LPVFGKVDFNYERNVCPLDREAAVPVAAAAADVDHRHIACCDVLERDKVLCHASILALGVLAGNQPAKDFAST